MGDAFYSWLLVLVLAEIATLFFLLFIRLGQSLRHRLFFAMLATCAAVFALLAAAVTLGEGPRAWAPEDGALLVTTTLLFSAFLFIALYAHNRGTGHASAHDDPFATAHSGSPKKGNCLLQGLGCLIIGPLLLAGFVLLIGGLTMFAP